MFSRVVYSFLIVARVLAVCRTYVSPLFCCSCINPIGRLVNISFMTIRRIGVANHNKRGKLSETLSQEPTKNIGGFVGDAQTVKLIYAPGVFRPTDTNTQPRTSGFSKGANSLHFAVLIQTERVANGTHPTCVMPAQNPRLALFVFYAFDFIIFQCVSIYCEIGRAVYSSSHESGFFSCTSISCRSIYPRFFPLAFRKKIVAAGLPSFTSL